MEEKFQLLKVRQFTEIINDSIAFFRRYFKPVGYTILLLVVPIYVLGSFFYSDIMNSTNNLGHATNVFNLKRFGVSSILGLLALVIGRMILTVIFISAFLHIEQSETGELASKDIFGSLRSNLARLTGFYLLVLLFGGVIGAIVAIIFAALGSASATGLIVILMLVFVPFLIYISVSLAFIPIIYMRENCGFGEAVSRSFYLVKNNWWWTLLILMVGGMIGSIGGLVFQLPYTILVAMKTFTSIRTGHTGYEVSIIDRVALTLSNFGSIITTAVVTIVTFMQYYSLVEKKDGISLMSQIDSIGSDENPSI